MSAAPVPVVSVNGRQVTVTFDVPFLLGDACITPRNFEKTIVNRMPDFVVYLGKNLLEARVECHGDWYTKSHTQMHGLGEFLPDAGAFLEFWLSEKDRNLFERFTPSLEIFFKDDPDALRRIKARHVELLRAEIDAEKTKIGCSVVLTTQKVTALEAALARATGAAA